MKNAILFVLPTVLLIFASCQTAVVLTADVQVIPAPAVTLDPNDPIWNDAPTHGSKLILQDLVEPRQMKISTQEVQVKAVTDGNEVAFRLEWIDESQNDAAKPHNFVDGCAVQLPLRMDANVPAPQMGEIGKTVQISYWRADWQAIVDGRADNIRSLYPNALPDHYPFEARSLDGDANAQREAALRYSPARALGNDRQGPRAQPVEDLVAEGPGTLTRNPQTFSKGKGVRSGSTWSVVIARPLPEGLSIGSPSQIAFAVWEGSQGETGARKMRTGWVTLTMK